VAALDQATVLGVTYSVEPSKNLLKLFREVQGRAAPPPSHQQPMLQQEQRGKGRREVEIMQKMMHNLARDNARYTTSMPSNGAERDFAGDEFEPSLLPSEPSRGQPPLSFNQHFQGLHGQERGALEASSPYYGSGSNSPNSERKLSLKLPPALQNTIDARFETQQQSLPYPSTYSAEEESLPIAQILARNPSPLRPWDSYVHNYTPSTAHSGDSEFSTFCDLRNNGEDEIEPLWEPNYAHRVRYTTDSTSAFSSQPGFLSSIPENNPMILMCEGNSFSEGQVQHQLSQLDDSSAFRSSF
jgi:hypothetical protein